MLLHPAVQASLVSSQNTWLLMLLSHLGFLHPPPTPHPLLLTPDLFLKSSSLHTQIMH